MLNPTFSFGLFFSFLFFLEKITLEKSISRKKEYLLKYPPQSTTEERERESRHEEEEETSVVVFFVVVFFVAAPPRARNRFCIRQFDECVFVVRFRNPERRRKQQQ